MKFCTVIAALMASACFAQTAPPKSEPKPPAEVEKALRARINEFYGMLLNREYRKAEALIADDTKDYYYDSSKPEITKFELLEVHFSDDFQHATAVTACTQKIFHPGFPDSQWTLHVPSLWKIENGQWVWYVNQRERLTPVGIVEKVPAPSGNAGPPAGPPGMPKQMPMTPDFALGKVGADKQTVTLVGDKPETVTIVNGAPGPVQLGMAQQLGLDLKLEPAALKGGEKATLTIRATKDARPGTLLISIMPTGESVAIQVALK